MALNFEEELLLKNINYKDYLKEIRKKADAQGYNWRSLRFADDNQHKMQITTPDNKIVKFGASEYNDFIIYGLMVLQKRMSLIDAMKHRENFHKRMKKTDDDMYTAKNLSKNLLW
jgi:hypothetical protein